MFNHGFGNGKGLAVLALIGLGVYSQNSEVNLANNTTILLILFLLLLETGEIEELKKEVECNERHIFHGNCHPERHGFRDNFSRFNCCNDCNVRAGFSNCRSCGC